VGTTIVGAGAALVTYLVCYGALSWRRRKRARPDGADPPPGARRASEPAA
jgi:hypothetical protein